LRSISNSHQQRFFTDSLEPLGREGLLGHQESEAYKDLSEGTDPRVLREIVGFTASKETLEDQGQEENLEDRGREENLVLKDQRVTEEKLVLKDLRVIEESKVQ